MLLYELFKTGGSEWEPYVQNLPKKFRGVPLTSFDTIQMNALQDGSLKKKIDERRVNARLGFVVVPAAAPVLHGLFWFKDRNKRARVLKQNP